MENSPEGSKSWRASAWGFGTLVKSLTSKSEEVLHSYQRDLQEFGLGLKKETAVAAEVTAHVVKDLPTSLESTAAVAQESLEAVGQTLEEFGSSFWRGTADLIGQVKEAVKKVDEEAVESSETSEASCSASAGRYSRYEAQLNAMQCDSSTYCDEPEDEEDYASWRSSFDVNVRKFEIGALLEENDFIKELHAKIVDSNKIDDSTFWTRYFYRLSKLQQAEDARADLVKRATAAEEDLSWEVEEDNEADVKANQPAEPSKVAEVIEEDEAKSDNSNGSEWLVVQDEHELDAPPTSGGREEKRTEKPSGKVNNRNPEEKEEDWGEWE